MQTEEDQKIENNTSSVSRGIRILVANPTATIVRKAGRLAVAHGLDRDGESEFRKAIDHPEPGAALSRIVTKQEDATIVLANAAVAGGPVLEAWRGATSNYEAYIANGEPGHPPAITDGFRDALALVPPARRVIAPQVLAHHLLFANVSGIRTYVAEIKRVGHGEHVRWQKGQTERRLFDPLVARPRTDAAPSVSIDIAFKRTVAALRLPDNSVAQLSGGIDSSLMQTYLPPLTRTIGGIIDSPEFSGEVAYAKRASQILGVRYEAIPTAESAFLEVVVDATRQYGLPLQVPQTVVVRAILDSPATCFINGYYADSLFGLKPSVDYAAVFDQRHLLHILEILGVTKVLPQKLAAGVQRRLGRLHGIEAPLTDWRGVGPRFATITNMALAERILGASAVQSSLEGRTAYVTERFLSEEHDPNPLFAHLELGHMVSFYCSDSLSRWRQLAYAQGKSVAAPYACRSMVEAALAIPRDRRYIANGRAKYLLKDLLKQRAPTFDVDAPKAGGDLPFQRYFLTGPLEHAFDRYPISDIVDRKTAAATRAFPDWLTWNLLTLAIWRDEVLSDRSLAPALSTRILMLSADQC